MVQPQTRQFFYITGIAVTFKVVIQIIQFLMMSKPGTVSLTSGGSTAIVHSFGATLTSWKVDGKEVLFVSEKSLFDNKKAIRGGVPFVFPNFGPWDDGRPQHGFARTSQWTFKESVNSITNSVTLILEDTEFTRRLWNFKFRIEYTITLINEKLKMDVQITNKGTEKFSFTLLLHTYFLVPDVLQCSISDFANCSYIDKVNNHQEFVEDRAEITLNKITDRIYKNTLQSHKVKNISGSRTATIEKFNLPDTVVWNPWTDGAKAMSDFGDDEWKNMICVEAGHVATAIELEPLNSFSAYQLISVE